MNDEFQSQREAMRERETRSLIWEPPNLAGRPSQAPVAIPIEEKLIALIVQPVDPHETHRAGNERKERELLSLLDTLSAVEALTLRRRLTVADKKDALVAAFQRLVVDRRARVIAFLDDARRRIALRERR